MTPFCRLCGNRKADHDQSWSRCYGFQPTERPACRVCGTRFDPAKSGREDCCFRHRLDS